MAKGEPSKYAKGEIANQTQYMKQGQNALEGNLYNSNQQFQKNYNQGVGMNLNSYDQIMGNYQNFLNGVNTGEFGAGSGSGGVGDYGDIYGRYQNLADQGGGYSFDPEFRGALSKALSGYGNFADTGGFSDQDLQDIRARAISPTRSIFSNAQSNIDRQRSLAGFSPNYTAAQAKLTRDLATSISDANVNANASIAQMVQQGKLAGLGGLSTTSLGGQNAQSNIDELNAQMKLAGLQGMLNTTGASGSASSAQAEADARLKLAAMSGMTSLYGTTPALADTFGNQVLNSGNQLLGAQGLRNQSSLGNLAAVTANKKQGIDWAGIAGAAASAYGTYAGLAALSDRNRKEDIEPIDEDTVLERLESLPISTWKYKGEKTKHVGPMAQDFKKHFGVGDGKTLAIVDFMGVMTAANKAMAKRFNQESR